MIVPISAVIATRDRAPSLFRTLESLLPQEISPSEINVIDASKDQQTKNVLSEFQTRLQAGTSVRWFPAKIAGSAPQRNEGVTHATQPFIWFLDDDILFEQDCVQRLWDAINSYTQLGGVNAMITNQRYQPPGRISRTMFTMMHGRSEESFAGKVIGPAINLLPEDTDDLPDVVPVEWLNTTCTIYRREALPDPPFDSFFIDYSLMEDVTLSIRLREAGWRLANARTARIYHDSQPGEHKSDIAGRAEMELINRYFVMTEVLHKQGLANNLRLTVWELFSILSTCTPRGSRKDLRSMLAGKWRAIRRLHR